MTFRNFLFLSFGVSIFVAGSNRAHATTLADTQAFLKANACGKKGVNCLTSEVLKTKKGDIEGIRYVMKPDQDSLGFLFMVRNSDYMGMLVKSFEGDADHVRKIFPSLMNQITYAFDGKYIVKQTSGTITWRAIIEPSNSVPEARLFGEARLNTMAINYLLRVAIAVANSKLDSATKKETITYLTGISMQFLYSLTNEIQAGGAGTRSKSQLCGPPGGAQGPCYFFYSRGGIYEKGVVYPHNPANYMASTLADLVLIYSSFGNLKNSAKALYASNSDADKKVLRTLAQGQAVSLDLLAAGTSYFAWGKPSKPWGPGGLAYFMTTLPSLGSDLYWIEYEQDFVTGKLDFNEDDAWIACHYHYATIANLWTLRTNYNNAVAKKTFPTGQARFEQALSALFATRGQKNAIVANGLRAPLQSAFEAATDARVSNWHECPHVRAGGHAMSLPDDYNLPAASGSNVLQDLNRWFKENRENPTFR